VEKQTDNSARSSLFGLFRTEREADNACPSSAHVRMACNHTRTPPDVCFLVVRNYEQGASSKR